MADLILAAPMQGWVAPLDEAPDAVFAERMLGDGLAIDPTGSSLHAPCAGTIIGVHHTRHAVTLRAGNGVEILMHIGLETVGLGGEGFEVHVRDGQSVEAGALLISFDIDLLARRAKSLVSPIVITNGEAFAVVRREHDHHVEIGAFLMAVRAVSAEVEAAPPRKGNSAERAIVAPLAHGIHARPAAAIAAVAKLYTSEVSLIASAGRANAKSPVALMTLGVRRNDPVTVSASGADAEAAVEHVVKLILSGIDEPLVATISRPATPAALIAPAAVDATPTRLKGVTAAPGLAVGVAARLVSPEIVVPVDGRGVAEEAAALAAALASVKARIGVLAETGARQHRAILGAHLAFLDDPELGDVAQRLIDEGRSAGTAWRGAVERYVAALRSVGDTRLAERVDDLVDLERQVLMALTGEVEAAAVLPEGAILLADDLLPSRLMGLDASRLAGLCTARGGPTSHVAILAAAMKIPAIVAVGAGIWKIADGAPLILDADAGVLEIAPDAAALKAAERAVEAGKARRLAARATAHEDCQMADGTRIEVFANLGSLADAHTALAAGAEGCGLLRTEFLFMDRDSPPDEDEQAACYQAIAEALGDRPLVIRTLDTGGDKPVDYLPIPPEDNPALGLRGVRVSLWRPDLLRTQLRAILRVRGAASPRIMIPMITSLSELTAVRGMVDQVRVELGRTQPVSVGVMIETPAAAVTADLICAEADFVSIGTNDLAQYALAIDRGNPLLAADADGLHPAVLRLIAETVAGARRHNRPVSVCGGLTSDLTAAPILIGLGATGLSASPAILPELKALIRTLTARDCAELAREALAQASAGAVRGLSLTGGRATPLHRGAV